jgi:glycosyltransferase involved in cell wall biosynthesis
MTKRFAMRICLVSSYPPVQAGESSYAQSYVHALETYLGNEISEIHVLSHVDGKNDQENITLESDKVKVYRLFDSHTFLSKNLCFLKIFRKIVQIRPDLVHFHYPPIPGSRFGGILGEPLLILFSMLKILRIPFFVTLHSIWYPDDVEVRAYELTKNRIISKFAKHYFKTLMYFFGTLPQTLFIMVSSKKSSKIVQAFSQAYHIPAEQLKEELHGLSHINKFSYADNEHIPKRIVCLGFIVPNKGYKYVLMAMKSVLKKIPDGSLLIAGSTISQEGREYFNELRNMVSENSLDRAVTLEERYLSEDEFKEYISNAGIVIVPYLKVLGVSGIMSLAISYKVPVIATCSGPLFEEISDIVSVVPPMNHHALANEIIKILSSKDYNMNIIRNYERYIADHDWAVVTRDIYEEYIKKLKIKKI